MHMYNIFFHTLRMIVSISLVLRSLYMLSSMISICTQSSNRWQLGKHYLSFFPDWGK